MTRAFAVIPVLDEAAAIDVVVRAVATREYAGVVVVDGGSRDGTPAIARAAGAIVVVERRRGYGRAVTAGIAEARRRGADALVIFDGNGSIDGAAVRAVLEPVVGGAADLAIGWRSDQSRLRPIQRAGNRMATAVVAATLGFAYRDVGPVRALTTAALDALALCEPGHGWPLALQARAAALGLRIVQVPVELGPRTGRSKVSGTLGGTVFASLAFLRVLAAECALPALFSTARTTTR